MSEHTLKLPGLSSDKFLGIHTRFDGGAVFPGWVLTCHYPRTYWHFPVLPARLLRRPACNTPSAHPKYR